MTSDEALKAWLIKEYGYEIGDCEDHASSGWNACMDYVRGQQEPVGYTLPNNVQNEGGFYHYFWSKAQAHSADVALYTTPPTPAQPEKYQVAWQEWHDKTEWVRERKDWPFIALGMHHADVIKKYVDYLEAQQAEPAVPLSMREALFESIAEALGEAYDCTRVWPAWSYGTMGPDDFTQVAEQADRVNEIVDAVLSIITPAQPAMVQQLVKALERCKFDSLNMSLEDMNFCKAALQAAKEAGL